MSTLTGWMARNSMRRRDRRALLVLWAVDSVGLATVLDLANITGLPAGSLYPVLARLEIRDLVTSEWVPAEPQPDGRPRRRYYQVTDAGRAHARKLAAHLKEFR